MRCEIPSREESIALAVKARAGDRRASEQLVRGHLRMVIQAAAKVQGRGLDLADLVQEGLAGMTRAIQTFDPERGFAFNTYASWWIKAMISRALERNPTSMIMSPRHRGMRGPLLPAMLSLDAPLYPESHGPETHGDNIASSEPRADDQLDRNGADSEVARLLRRMGLTSRERDVLRLRLMADEPQTLDEISKKHGVSRERIRQIELALRIKLKRRLASVAA